MVYYLYQHAFQFFGPGMPRPAWFFVTSVLSTAIRVRAGEWCIPDHTSARNLK